MITSAHNSRLQLARALAKRPKDRQQEKAFLVEGIRLAEEAERSGWPFRFSLYTNALSPRGKVLIQRLQSRDIPCEEVDPSLLRAVSDTETSQGLLAVLDLAPLSIPSELSFVLVLDSIRDPGNLGTLLRTASAAGVEAVFLPPETADAFAPKVVRAGMGAHFHLPIHSLSWEEIGERLKALKVYLAEMEGSVPCWEADLISPLALVIGGEAEGATEPARQLAQTLLSIPMPGQAESLNAGVAGAILMFEVVRQRNNK